MTLTPEAQRIAIAEACGITNIQKGGLCYLTEHTISQRVGASKPVPDYLNDLNAMHESLKMQDRKFNYLFSEQLYKISTLRGCYVHELTAKDWADCFISVLQSKDDACPQSEIATTANP